MSGITLQFASESNVASRIIEYYDHGIFAHVDAVTPDGLFYGARFRGGVMARLAGYAPFTRRLLVDVEAAQPQVDAFWSFMRDQLGKPYDGAGIAGFVAGRSWRRPDSWFCSELVGAALETSSVFVNPLCTPSCKLAPDDLLIAVSVNTVVDLSKTETTPWSLR